MPSHIIIRGCGAVSPAGWGADSLASAVLNQKDIPTSLLEREGKSDPALARPVPKPDPPLPFARDPRLRRTSSLGRYGIAAALEALGESREKVESGTLRTGIIFCEMNGIVEYSRRFYEQVRENPAFASPILFPETVYNAPSSHLSAVLGSTEINYTVLGDSAQFITGLDLAAHWLSTGRTDACLVVAAEELDWLSAEAVQLFAPQIPVSEGAAALFLERTSSPRSGDVEITKVTPPQACSQLYNPAATDESAPILQTLGTAFSVDAGWQSVLAAHRLISTPTESSATIRSRDAQVILTRYESDTGQAP